MTNKPMIIALDEAERLLVGAVNNALSIGVTPYFLKMIYEKVGSQIDKMATDEMNTVRANWQKQIAENEAKKTENSQEKPETSKD